MYFKKVKIALASASPRRQELIGKLGYAFRVLLPQVEECYPPEMDVHDVPLYLARLKARAVEGQIRADEWLITADTVVILDGEIIEKPAGPAEAEAHLRRLSGRRHTVVTGVCMKHGKREYAFSDFSDVYFRNLPEALIRHYVEQGDALDKAGAYGIQDWFGMVGIEKIDGNYFNVMGLPVHRVFETLQKHA